MSLHDTMRADLHGVFLNLNEFAERCDIQYDGELYRNVPVQISGKKERDREPGSGDHAQKMYRSSYTVHLAASDIDGKLPERGVQFDLFRAEAGAEYWEHFYVDASSIQEGMLRLELEVTDE